MLTLWDRTVFIILDCVLVILILFILLDSPFFYHLYHLPENLYPTSPVSEDIVVAAATVVVVVAAAAAVVAAAVDTAAVVVAVFMLLFLLFLLLLLLL